jgi:hypothetical protein
MRRLPSAIDGKLRPESVSDYFCHHDCGQVGVGARIVGISEALYMYTPSTPRTLPRSFVTSHPAAGDPIGDFDFNVGLHTIPSICPVSIGTGIQAQSLLNRRYGAVGRS